MDFHIFVIPFKALQACAFLMLMSYIGLQGVTSGCRGLQEVTGGYRRLQGVTKGHRGLQGVTRGYKELKRVKNVKKG